MKLMRHAKMAAAVLVPVKKVLRDTSLSVISDPRLFCLTREVLLAPL